jgi:UDP-2-acetamido-3-amino-2,3-dideoxy-glucuronate N-acetyltransferase
MQIAATAVVDPRATLGKNVQVADYVVICGAAEIGDDVQLDVGCVVGADSRSESPRPTRIEGGSFIGARAVVLDGVRVGAGSVVQPGAVVTAETPPLAVVQGNPAEVVDYVTAFQAPLVTLDIDRMTPGDDRLPAGVSVCRLGRVVDLRGALTIGDIHHVPFDIARAYFVSGVGQGLIRGAHAHRRCHQLLIAVQGSLTCVVDDGRRRIEIRMTRPELSLHIEPMVWGTQYQFEPSSVLAVLASLSYDPDEYIADYQLFLDEVGAERPRGGA